MQKPKLKPLDIARDISTGLVGRVVMLVKDIDTHEYIYILDVLPSSQETPGEFNFSAVEHVLVTVEASDAPEFDLYPEAENMLGATVVNKITGKTGTVTCLYVHPQNCISCEIVSGVMDEKTYRFPSESLPIGMLEVV